MINADNPWKDMCERKWSLVLELLFPQLHAALDWSEDPESLDQELRRFSPASQAGGRIADRLIKSPALESGDPRYLHLEVQGKREQNFARRIHQCNLRAEERFDAHVISLVVLTDKNPRWRPRRYIAGQVPLPSEQRRRGFHYQDQRTLHFLMVKLIDFRDRMVELEEMTNPVGLFVVAHLEALRTRKDVKERQAAKLRLFRNLRQRKMDVEDARLWAACLDWFLQLPAEREQAVTQELAQLDREDSMAFVSFIERQAEERGLQTGRQEGRQEGLQVGVGQGRLEALRWYLNARIGVESQSWMSKIEQIADEQQLRELCESLFAADSPEVIRTILVSQTGEQTS